MSFADDIYAMIVRNPFQHWHTEWSYAQGQTEGFTYEDEDTAIMCFYAMVYSMVRHIHLLDINPLLRVILYRRTYVREEIVKEVHL